MTTRHTSASIRRSAKQPEIVFDGTITKEIRKHLRETRRQLGVSLQQLGSFLQINWSTIRKWETGQTTYCHARHVIRIGNFLNHKYDNRLLALCEPNRAYIALMQSLPEPLRECLERAWTIYGVSRCYPGEDDHLFNQMEKSIDTIAQIVLRRNNAMEHLPTILQACEKISSYDSEEVFD